MRGFLSVLNASIFDPPLAQRNLFLVMLALFWWWTHHHTHNSIKELHQWRHVGIFFFYFEMKRKIHTSIKLLSIIVTFSLCLSSIFQQPNGMKQWDVSDISCSEPPSRSIKVTSLLLLPQSTFNNSTMYRVKCHVWSKTHINFLKIESFQKKF
jgi:hypothetical protein